MSTMNPLTSSPLENLHIQNGAKMVPFAGWNLPISYADSGIVAEHKQTRHECSLFDVSHMCQFQIDGENRTEFLQKLVPLTAKLRQGLNKYTVMCNEQGGILDDMIVANDGDHIFVICNAARSQVILDHVKNNLPEGCTLTVHDKRALLAVQGPKAIKVISEVISPSLLELKFMESVWIDYQGLQVRVCRCGYTGEDGFEISIQNNEAENLANKLLANENCKLAGLGARDVLRLEAGLCLYGQDLNDQTTPIEASLQWTIGKKARELSLYKGADTINKQLEEGASRCLVGLKIVGKIPARKDTELFIDDKKIGEVTSGGFSPVLGHPIAFAYVQSEYAQIDTKITARVRKSSIDCTICATPFYTKPSTN